MVVVVSTLILIYLIDTFLVGVTFFALKERFQWSISKRMSLFILFVVFVFLEYYILPMVVVLDVTFTVGNPDIAGPLGLKPDEPFAGLFDFGFFEVLVMVSQALLAALVGEKMLMRKTV